MSPLFHLFETWIDPFRDPPQKGMPHGGVRFLLYFVSQVRWPFIAMLVLGGASAFVEVTVFNFLGRIVDLLENGNRATFFSDHASTLLWMVFVVLILRTIVNSLMALVEEQAVVPGFFNLVRWQSHQRVMRQSLSYFQDDLAGRLAQKVMQSGMSAGDFMINLLQVVWFIIVYAITTLVLITELDVRLGAIVALWLVCFAVTALYFVPRIRNASKETAHSYSGVTGRLVDTYTNIQSVKLFGSMREENQGARRAVENFTAKLRQFTRYLTSIRMIMSLINGVMIVSITAMALNVWQDGNISTGHVAFALSLILRLNILLNRLFNQLNGLFRHFGSLQDSMETIVKPVSLVDLPDARALSVDQGAIKFENIRFHYGKDGGVIDHLNLSIEPGERVGLVGPSGAGKTTLVSLLLRFFDLEAGRVIIDGQDVRNVAQESLRRSIGMVTQDTSLLHRSIRENILYGRSTASDADLVDAARKAHALDFIQQLEDKKGRTGFDAFVGERGVKLSGGQRQRIAIARVLVKNAPILVLDEATSALDSEVEAAIQDNLQSLMAGKTVIAIAHRLSTIAAMDRLIVMDNGRIVQQGTHETLLADKTGLYAQLWHRQSGGFLKADVVPA
ncbi:Putative multidrug export ATP-binding/permease protein [Roseibium album]|uniref:Putative multidrug export ATP-binding/permease protein n=2 Tax=Roseibium album TaxID=311410 RepID=A0A0M6ZBE5_9HYPH|nr:Putative multidrug export ATP-binding/permease protein [Roseibium album]CTQ77377.1 Putative multidrug export ATP-binding/permease protein [Roseibium album]CTQ77594.1 Putative multidrug export ATP-binding/permease protein [Roseibium album]